VRSAHQRFFDTAMLKPKRDLEMKDVFAVALEAKVSRLDDSRVHRSHGDFVNLAAFDFEESSHAGPATMIDAHRR
jgi:hypothetical protein